MKDQETKEKEKRQEYYQLLSKQIQEIKTRRKRRKLSSSVLNKHLDAILYLYFVEQSSYGDIALWLRVNKRTKVTRQAVQQFTKKHLDTIELEKNNS